MALESKRSSDILQLFTESLRLNPPIAAKELYHDSQTQNLIKELGNFKEEITLLDYGCGNLRLLQGLKSTDYTLPIYHYFATDIVLPERTLLENNSGCFLPLEDLRKSYSFAFDVIVLMNVIHEVSIHSFATILEDCRRILKPTGFLYLIDMSLLPEGEPISLPYYSWELGLVFKDSQDISYMSKTGIPIAFMKIPQTGIPCYSMLVKIITEIVEIKRDSYSEVACQLHYPEKKAKYEWLIEKLLLSGDNSYNLGLLMLLSGYANYRLMEEYRREPPNNQEITETAITILQYFFDKYRNSREIISLKNIYQKIGTSATYDSIRYAMMQMTVFGGFFFPISDDELPLTVSETLDAFEDYYTLDEIRRLGITMMQYECYEKIYPS